MLTIRRYIHPFDDDVSDAKQGWLAAGARLLRLRLSRWDHREGQSAEFAIALAGAFVGKLRGFARRATPRELRREPTRPAALGRKTRVMQVLECGGPGGTGNQVAALCNGLAADRFETTLVYSVRPGQDAEEYRAKAAGAVRAHLVREMTREISPVNDLRALVRLVGIIRRESPDTLHAHSSKAGVLARLAGWWCRVPRIYYSPHGYAFLQTDRTTLSRRFYRLLEWSVSWIGEIVAACPSEAELGRRLSWGKPVHTVWDSYLGPVEPPPPRPLGGFVFGACGRLTPARNPEAFLRLAVALCRSRPEARGVWIGSGEGEADFRHGIEAMGLTGRVELTGWLAPEEVLERMRGLDIFVHFSRWDGLPNAVLEAMAIGLPVLASDIPGNRDAVVPEQTGLLARDEDELLDLAERLAADPGLRTKLGSAGRERVFQEFSPERALTEMTALYLR